MVVLAMLDVGEYGVGQEDDGEVVEKVWVSWHEQSEDKVGHYIDKENPGLFL